MKMAIQKDVEDDDDAKVEKCEHCGSSDHLSKDCAVMKAASDLEEEDESSDEDTEEAEDDGLEDEMPEDKAPDEGKGAAKGLGGGDSLKKDDEEDTEKGLGGGDSLKKEMSDDYVEKGGAAGDKPSDFAYVPDSGKPSTWKLDISDATHVGGAVAALGPGGFRGAKVSIPDADLAVVKAKVRAAWKKFHPDADPEDVPAVIKSNTTVEALTAKAEELSKKYVA